MTINRETCAICGLTAPGPCKMDRVIWIHRPGDARAYHHACVTRVLDLFVIASTRIAPVVGSMTVGPDVDPCDVLEALFSAVKATTESFETAAIETAAIETAAIETEKELGVEPCPEGETGEQP